MIRISRQDLPLLATAAVAVLSYIIFGFQYKGFFSPQVFINFFTNNAMIGIVAVGMTFVIISGGIDLSVGSVAGCSSILVATLITQHGIHPVPAFAAALLMGGILGAVMGIIIHVYRQPPFLVTLAGMFFARGLGFTISNASESIRHPFYTTIDRLRVPVPFTERAEIHFVALLLLVVVIVGVLVARYTQFGRNTYAIGGSEQSALLMGLPVGRTKITVYTVSGLCAALAGIVRTLSMSSGDPAAGVMWELDAIAAVVIGGTLLSGGVGSVIGTLIGVLILAIIQTAIDFDGRLSSWWTRIAVGALLLAFIAMQRLAHSRLEAK